MTLPSAGPASALRCPATVLAASGLLRSVRAGPDDGAIAAAASDGMAEGGALGPGQLGLLPGVPEARLTSAVADRLPPSAPPPPWELRLDTVLWTHRRTGAATSALPGPLRGRAGAGLTIAGFVRYTESPVGPYSELLASPTLIRGALTRLYVPLIAVDSLASLLGGRAYWALPKTLASFSGHPAGGETIEASGAGWWVRAQVRARGPRVPAVVRVSLGQVWPDGSIRTFPSTFRGRLGLATVDVAVSEGASFAGWLRGGHHRALLLGDARLRLPAPRPEAPVTLRVRGRDPDA